MRALITGAAGFIGFHLASALLAKEWQIVGLDNLNSYYDVMLKNRRLAKLQEFEGFSLVEADLADIPKQEERLVGLSSFDAVIHLAAQAGVRYSISHPQSYIQSNVQGTLEVLEFCRRRAVPHLIYASSSSVYGSNFKAPFSTEDRTDSPVSLYAATKKATELMAQTYAHLYGQKCTGLRFFTVYGPWGRPDMAYFKFADAITNGKSIDVYNSGDMQRDFTYIDDIVRGLESIVQKGFINKGNHAPHNVYNLGNSRPEPLTRLIELLERSLRCTASKTMLPMQMGDVVSTYADIAPAFEDYGFQPLVNLEEGIDRFVAWYRSYRKFGPLA